MSTDGSLNPLFIRSFYQTDQHNRIVRGKFRLNPLFIRSFYQTYSSSEWWWYGSLNPLFIRSFYQTRPRLYIGTTATVLIPYSSGHSIKPVCARKSAITPNVLIPYSSGHSIKRRRCRLLQPTVVLIPYSSGHSIKHFRKGMNIADCASLNPLFIRSFYQTRGPDFRRLKGGVLIPYSSGHSIKRDKLLNEMKKVKS